MVNTRYRSLRISRNIHRISLTNKIKQKYLLVRSDTTYLCRKHYQFMNLSKD